MDEAEKKRLESLGYSVGDYGDFLGLTDAERQEIELRGALLKAIRGLRESGGLTQKAVAKMIGSTQSRIAKVESGTTIEVSLDLMFRVYFGIGGRMEDLVVRPSPPAKPLVVHPEAKPRPRKRLAKREG